MSVLSARTSKEIRNPLNIFIPIVDLCQVVGRKNHLNLSLSFSLLLKIVKPNPIFMFHKSTLLLIV